MTWVRNSWGSPTAQGFGFVDNGVMNAPSTRAALAPPCVWSDNPQKSTTSHTNGAYNITALSNSSGTVVERYGYDGIGSR